MTWTRTILGATTMALVLFVGACSDAADPLGPTSGGDQSPNDQVEATFGIVMRPAPDATASAARDGGPARASISLSKVESITLELGDVEARNEDGDWVEAGSVDPDLAEVDLLALPDEGLHLVDTSLPAGSYDKLRVFLTADPTITLSEDLRVGRTTYEAGEHPLVIPSSDDNGVRLRADFEMDEDGELLTVEFDGAATVRRVIATGGGTLKISPELRVHDEEGAEVGELEEEPEDEDEESEDGDEEERLEVESVVTGVDAEGGTFTVDHDGEELTVAVNEDTEVDGDIMTLEAVAEALDNEETVTAEAEGVVQEDGSLLADEVEFESDTEDEAEDDDESYEVEGDIAAVDAEGGTVDVEHRNDIITVVTDDATEVELHEDFESLADVAAALDEGEAAIEAEAEGVLQDDGSLLAATLEIRPDHSPAQDDEHRRDDGNGNDEDHRRDGENGRPDDRGQPDDRGGDEDEDDEDAETRFEVTGAVTSVDTDAGTFAVDEDGTEHTVTVNDETRIVGDYDSLSAVADALDAGTAVRAEASGTEQEDGTLLAETAAFENDDSDDEEGGTDGGT